MTLAKRLRHQLNLLDVSDNAIAFAIFGAWLLVRGPVAAPAMNHQQSHQRHPDAKLLHQHQSSEGRWCSASDGYREDCGFVVRKGFQSDPESDFPAQPSWSSCLDASIGNADASSPINLASSTPREWHRRP
jgi:hypothetical protein